MNEPTLFAIFAIAAALIYMHFNHTLDMRRIEDSIRHIQSLTELSGDKIRIIEDQTTGVTVQRIPTEAPSTPSIDMREDGADVQLPQKRSKPSEELQGSTSEVGATKTLRQVAAGMMKDPKVDHEKAKKQFYAKLKALEKTRGIKMPKMPADKVPKQIAPIVKPTATIEVGLTAETKPSPPPASDEPAPGSMTPNFATSKQPAGLFEDNPNPSIKSKLLFGSPKDSQSDDMGGLFKMKDSTSAFPGIASPSKPSDNPFAQKSNSSKPNASLFSDDNTFAPTAGSIEPKASDSLPFLDRKPSRSSNVFESNKQAPLYGSTSPAPAKSGFSMNTSAPSGPLFGAKK